MPGNKNKKKNKRKSKRNGGHASSQTPSKKDVRKDITVAEGLSEGLYYLDESTSTVTDVFWLPPETCGAEMQQGGGTHACLRARGKKKTLVEDACDTNTLLEHNLCVPCHDAGIVSREKDKKAGKGETYDQVYARAGPYHRVANIEDMSADRDEPGDFQMSARFTQDESEAFAEKFSKTEQWARLRPHALRHAEGAVEAWDEEDFDGLTVILHECYDKSYGEQRMLYANTTPEAMAEHRSLVGKADEILEALVQATQVGDGEKGNELLLKARKAIMEASPQRLGANVASYGIGSSGSVADQAGRLLSVTRSAVEFAVEAVKTDEALSGLDGLIDEKDENGNVMSPQTPPPPAGDDIGTSHGDAQLLAGAMMTDEARHPIALTTSGTATRKLDEEFRKEETVEGEEERIEKEEQVLSWPWDRVKSELKDEKNKKEEVAGERPEEMTKNKNTNKKQGGEKDRARDQEQGYQHDQEREKDEQDGNGASGNKQWARGFEAKVNTHGRKNNYWVCIGGSVEGGKVFTDKEEARKAKEYQHCLFRGFRTITECREFLEANRVEALFPLTPGTVYPYKCDQPARRREQDQKGADERERDMQAKFDALTKQYELGEMTRTTGMEEEKVLEEEEVDDDKRAIGGDGEAAQASTRAPDSR